MSERSKVLLRDYSSFCPEQYFAEYYSKIGSENRFLLQFLHDAYRDVSSDSRVLEFGSGPTVYQILSAARRVSQIVVAEFLAINRKHIRNWLDQKHEALCWDAYLDYVLRFDGSEASVCNRRRLHDQIAPKITEIIECDAYLPRPLGHRSDDKFDIVSSNFCLECIDAREDVFKEIVEKITSMVEQNGKLILTMLQNARSYQIADISLPSFAVDPDYMKSLLKSLGYQEISISTHAAEHSQGYQGLFALTAIKR